MLETEGANIHENSILRCGNAEHRLGSDEL